jgi:5-methylcytosine-specific restriction endonuclease McrA
VSLLQEAAAVLEAERVRREDHAAKARAKKGRSQRFYASYAWARLRYKALVESKGKCQACGRGAADGVVIHVDHVVPISKCWERRLDRGNLQILCGPCNWAKSNTSNEDWR